MVISTLSPKTIYTIGHSTHDIEDFVAMLESFQIETLIDVRSFPGSRRYPHFHKENLGPILTVHEIEYVHLREL